MPSRYCPTSSILNPRISILSSARIGDAALRALLLAKYPTAARADAVAAVYD